MPRGRKLVRQLLAGDNFIWNFKVIGFGREIDTLSNSKNCG